MCIFVVVVFTLKIKDELKQIEEIVCDNRHSFLKKAMRIELDNKELQSKQKDPLEILKKYFEIWNVYVNDMWCNTNIKEEKDHL